jgi:hypothetical protein
MVTLMYASFPHSRRSMIDVLPNLAICIGRHRLVKLTACESGNHRQHFISGQSHLSAAIECCLGESSSPEATSASLNLREIVVWNLFSTESRIPYKGNVLSVVWSRLDSLL